MTAHALEGVREHVGASGRGLLCPRLSDHVGPREREQQRLPHRLEPEGGALGELLYEQVVLERGEEGSLRGRVEVRIGERVLLREGHDHPRVRREGVGLELVRQHAHVLRKHPRESPGGALKEAHETIVRRHVPKPSSWSRWVGRSSGGCAPDRGAGPELSARQLGLPKLAEAPRELLELLLPPPDESLVDREAAPHVSVGPLDRKSADAGGRAQRGEGNGVRLGAVRRDHVEITSHSISRGWNGDQLRLEDTGVHLRTMALGRLARPSLGAVDVAKRVDPFRSSGGANDTLGTEIHLRRLAFARHESEAFVHVDVRTQALRRDRHRFDRRRFEWLCSELLE